MDIQEVQLWDKAKARVSFRWHATIYCAIISLLWLGWYLSGDTNIYHTKATPWPIFPTLGWGIGLLSHYLAAYRNAGETAVKKEFQKLKAHSK